MPGGRGTLDQVTDAYIEQIKKVEEENFSQSVKVAAVEKIGDIMAASIDPNYELNTDESGYK